MFKKSKLFWILLVLCLLASSKVFAEKFQPCPDTIPFAPPVNYPVGHQPRCVCGADFDGDGDIDLAVANEGDNTVSILENSGNGMFQPAVEYLVGAHPFSVFPADFDTDGYYDLVVANSGDSTITILMNQGDGAFILDSVYQVDHTPVCVSSADLDGDGDFDVVVACTNWGHSIYILENNGDATFLVKQVISISGISSFFLADLDKDGDCDIAALMGDGSEGGVYIYKNYGNGTFYLSDHYHYGGALASIFGADFDLDGDYDLAVANQSSPKIGVFKNNGNGTFQPPIDYLLPTGAQCVFGKDLDQDGDCDLIVAIDGGDGRAAVLQNNGDGTFQNPVLYLAGDQPVSVFSADLDSDMVPDLVTANRSSDDISVLLNKYVWRPGGYAWLNVRGWPDITVAETLTYYIEYGNAGVRELTQCSLSVHIPPQMGYVSANPAGFVIDTTILWEIGTMEGGTIERITLDLTLNESVGTPDSTFEIHARLTGHEEFARGMMGSQGEQIRSTNNSFTQIFVNEIKERVSSADLIPDKEPSGDFHGGKNCYTISISNIGSITAAHGGNLIEYIEDLHDCLYAVDCHYCEVVPDGNDYILKWAYSDWIPSRGSLPLDNVCVFVTSEPRCNGRGVGNRLDVASWDDLFINNNIRNYFHYIALPKDPNDISIAPNPYVRPGQLLSCTIRFENEGSAPAESVRISSVVDTVLAEQTLFFDDTIATYNGYTRTAIWDFPNINLQPDSSSYVFYGIYVKDNLQSGTVIEGNAMIYFDYMPGVPCSVSVTVDALNPMSQVDSVIRVAFSDTYEVFWSGYDPTPGSSGIMSYSIYFSMDGGLDSLWLADTSWFEEDTLQTSATFVGQPGHYYCFSSIAMDRVWNIEEPPGAPDACLPFLRGDANADWKVDVTDVVYLINYLFINGPPPNPVERADCNCDHLVNVTDVVYLINFLFINGPPPQC
jgi:hypothetical protein